MTNSNRKNQQEIKELRIRAEEKTEKQSDRLFESYEEMSTEQVHELLQELSVHQIELEIQNDELRRTRDEFEALTARYFDLYDLAPVGYCTVSNNGLILEINFAGATLLGMNRSELVTLPLSRFIFADDQDIFYHHFNTLLGSGGAKVSVLRMAKHDGTIFWVRMESAVTIKENGTLICRLMLVDISTTKIADDELQKSNRFNATLLKTIPFPLDIVDQTGHVFYMNDQMKQVVGENSLGGLCWELYKDDRKQCAECPLHQPIKVGETAFVEIDAVMGGKSVQIIHTGMIYEKKEALMQIFIDITDSKNAENELQESEKRFSATFEQAAVGIALVGLDGTWLKVNQKLCSIVGYNQEELLEKTFHDITYPSDLAEDLKNVQLLLDGKIKSYDIEKRYVKKDKSVVWINLTASLMRKRSGMPDYFIAVVQNIDDRKRAEADRELLMAAFEQNGETIIITDPNGFIMFVNRTFEVETGYNRQEVQGEHTRILKSGKQDDEFYRELWDTIANGHVFTGRMVNQRKDGSFFTEDVTISPVLNAAGELTNYVASKRNVTDHIQLEEEYRQAQKMESIGRLAGGVAHDYNNMLSVIMGFTELAMSQQDISDSVRDDLKEVYKAALTSADITRQLLAFARQQPVIPRVTDLNETVEGMLKMLRRLIGEDINLYWAPCSQICSIMIDPSQIDQILANLCVNARDAIKGVGSITVEVKRVTIDEVYCAQHKGSIPGKYIKLAVIDDGCGIDDEFLDKIFEPFYTTKELGKGTGLGLATVYGIVKQNHSYITVESSTDEGTEIAIFFPRHKEIFPVVAQAGKSCNPRGHGQRILIVEDDEAVLLLTSKALEEIGYTVFSSSTVDGAVSMMREQGHTIDLLITDVIMPGMNGRELGQLLQSSKTDLKIVYMSGHTSDVFNKSGLITKDILFIQKPFSLDELARVVAKAIRVER